MENDTETTNSTPQTFDFGRALFYLKSDKSVSRMGWNGEEQSLTLQVPDENSKMTLPYIYIKTVQGDLVPWIASQTDLMAEDWFACETPETPEDKKTDEEVEKEIDEKQEIVNEEIEEAKTDEPNNEE